jgi:hypothetical protein
MICEQAGLSEGFWTNIPDWPGNIEWRMEMKKILTALAMTLLLLPAMALANAPEIEITAPTQGTVVYVPEFPAIVPVTFTVTHIDTVGQKSGLTLLNVLDVLVDNVSLLPLGEIGNPFQQGSSNNVCSDLVLTVFSACGINSDGTVATLTYDWIVDGIGTYPLTITSRHTGTGIEEEEQNINVELLLVDVEHPAPPAVANAILKTMSKLKGGVHGCVISKIANAHAQQSKYGPKGGPYNKELIESDVDLFLAQCK